MCVFFVVFFSSCVVSRVAFVSSRPRPPIRACWLSPRRAFARRSSDSARARGLRLRRRRRSRAPDAVAATLSTRVCLARLLGRSRARRRAASEAARSRRLRDVISRRASSALAGDRPRRDAARCCVPYAIDAYQNIKRDAAFEQERPRSSAGPSSTSRRCTTKKRPSPFLFSGGA